MLLSAADLRFGYGQTGRGHAAASGLHVIDGVSLEISTGDIVGILGPNGSGKTTLLRLLSGVLAPKTGTVTLDGSEVPRLPRRSLAQRVALVPQETSLAFDYTVLEIVLMGRYPHLGAFEIEGPDEDGCVWICSPEGRRDLLCHNLGPKDRATEVMFNWHAKIGTRQA